VVNKDVYKNFFDKIHLTGLIVLCISTESN